MSEYIEKHSISKLIGAPPGYVGFDEGGQLTTAIKENPHCILLLDEIEKAHPDLLNILLQVMDSGNLTDAHGRPAHFSNSILIMTSNLGARESSKSQIGISKNTEHFFNFQALDEAVKKFFSPEFINRLTSIINFQPLNKECLMDVIRKFLLELKDQVQDKGWNLTWESSVEDFIFEKGYDPLMGARPFQRTINNFIKKVLVQPLLFEENVVNLSPQPQSNLKLVSHSPKKDSLSAYKTLSLSVKDSKIHVIKSP